MTTPRAARAFRDAGTERAFAQDEDLSDVEAGSLANYRAAGLVADVADAAPAPAEATPPATTPETPAKTATKRKAA